MPERGKSPDDLRWERKMYDADIFDLVEREEWPTLPGYRSARKRKPRRPSIRAQIAAAEKAGKTVTSVTTSDGTVLHFGEPTPAEARNPWLADLAKGTKQ